MFTSTITALVLFILLSVYVAIVRPLLKTQPILSATFKAEASLFDKLRAKIVGWRTKIMARLVIISGLAVGLYNEIVPIAVAQDWSPLTAKVPAWTIPLGLVAIGWGFEKLRNITANPPQVIVQKDDAGVARVVDLVMPAK
jgi:hypothetical protein